jgi:hypothetical protein
MPTMLRYNKNRNENCFFSESLPLVHRLVDSVRHMLRQMFVLLIVDIVLVHEVRFHLIFVQFVKQLFVNQ